MTPTLGHPGSTRRFRQILAADGAAAPGFVRRWMDALHLLGEKPARASPYPLRARPTQPCVPAAIVIAASADGASALQNFLVPIARRIEAPILIAMDTPAGAAEAFAHRLELATSKRCRVAAEGDVAAPGAMLLAPSGRAMRIARCPAGRMIHLDDAGESGPLADALFESAALAFGPRILAIVLAGPGEDGCAGARRIADAGGRVLVQDEASSVMWSMPGAVARAGHAEAVRPVKELSQLALRVMNGDDA